MHKSHNTQAHSTRRDEQCNRTIPFFFLMLMLPRFLHFLPVKVLLALMFFFSIPMLLWTADGDRIVRSTADGSKLMVELCRSKHTSPRHVELCHFPLPIGAKIERARRERTVRYYSGIVVPSPPSPKRAKERKCVTSSLPSARSGTLGEKILSHNDDTFSLARSPFLSLLPLIFRMRAWKVGTVRSVEKG